MDEYKETLEKQNEQECHCTGVGKPKESTGILKQLLDEEKSCGDYNNKICTTLEQSKKLIKLGIDVNTADFAYLNGNESGLFILTDKYKQSDYLQCDTPAWSLTALLDLLPNIIDKQPILTRGKLTGLWYCYYEDEIDTQTYDNPIDAVFEMICLLRLKYVIL